MATHMLRKSCYNLLRISALRQQAARQISVLANRNPFSTERVNDQARLVQTSQNIRPPMLHVSWFSEGLSLTAADLEQRTLEVIKSFDKVDPDKVRTASVFVFYMLGLLPFPRFVHVHVCTDFSNFSL